MTTIKGLPVYNAILLDEGCGIDKISLVDLPAVESNFLVFSEARMMRYTVKDEEKHLLYGCVMRANFPIYRADMDGEYWIVYKPEVIRQMAEKYLADGKANNVNLMHEDGTDVDGVQMVQWFLKDTAKGINPVGFEDIEDGSLFGEFHVSNPDVWAAVKDGVFKGFSLEGMFGVRATNAVVSEEKITYKKVSKMSMLEKFREVCAKVFAAFGAVSTDKGVLFWDGDEDLKAGDAVFKEDENGERIAAEDGEYVIEDGKVIVVADGKVAEIKDAEAEVAPAEPEAEPEANAEESEPAAEPEAPAEPEADPLEERIKGIEDRIAGLEDAVNRIAEAVGVMASEQKHRSMAKPAHEEFREEMKAESTGNAKMDRFMQIARCSRK